MLDTVGFITDLPHGLVESFKATLEEMHFADVIVHVRDISHPQTLYQRDTVLQVLKEIGVGEEELAQKYIEVWNKIDLIEDRRQFEEQYAQELEESKPDYPVVMMSCKTGENKSLFLEKVGELASKVMGKKYYRLEYPYDQHNKRISWLYKHSSITQEEDFEYEGDVISVKVLLDEVTYQRYLKEFEREIFDSSAARSGVTSKNLQAHMGEKRQDRPAALEGRGMPPPGWTNS